MNNQDFLERSGCAPRRCLHVTFGPYSQGTDFGVVLEHVDAMGVRAMLRLTGPFVYSELIDAHTRKLNEDRELEVIRWITFIHEIAEPANRAARATTP